MDENVQGNIQAADEQSQPVKEPPSSWIKNFLVFVALAAVVIGSFWISFQLGKRILIPVRKPAPRIEAIIPEPPPSIQKLQAALSKEAAGKRVVCKPGTKIKKVCKAKPVVRRAAGRHYYKVQAGWYTDKGKAKSLADRIKAKGFNIYLKRVSGGWRVQVGAFRSKSEAKAQQGTLQEKGFSSKIIFE